MSEFDPLKALLNDPEVQEIDAERDLKRRISDQSDQNQREEAVKEHGSLMVNVGEFVEDKPKLRTFLQHVARPASTVANLAEAAVEGVKGEGGAAMKAFRRAAANVQGVDLDDPTNTGSFSRVLEKAGVPEMGEFEDPTGLLGRFTGRGAAGLALDMIADPLKGTRIASPLSKSGGKLGRRAAIQLRNPIPKIGASDLIGQAGESATKRALMFAPRAARTGFRALFDEGDTILATPRTLDEALGRRLGAVKDAALSSKAIRAVAQEFNKTFVTPEQSSKFSQPFTRGRKRAFEARYLLQEKGQEVIDEAYRVGAEAGLTPTQVDEALLSGEKFKRAKKLRELDSAELNQVRNAVKQYREMGFSPQESLDAAKAVATVPNIHPDLAPFASQYRRIMRGIIEVEQSVGIDINSLTDPGLFYINRYFTRPAQRLFRDLRGRRKSKAQQILSRAFDASTPVRRRRSQLFEGKSIAELEDFLRSEFPDFKGEFLEKSPEKILRNRLLFAEKGMTAANFAQGVIDDFGRVADARGPGDKLASDLFGEDLALRFQREGSSVGLEGADKYIPAEIVDYVQPILEKMRNPETPGLIGKLWDAQMGFFKTGVTVFWPDFFKRNALSNVIANYFGDVVDPKVYADSYSSMRKYWKLLHKKGVNEVIEFADGRKMTIREFFDRMDSDGVVGLTSTASSVEELGGSAGAKILEPFTDAAESWRAGQKGISFFQGATAPIRFLARGGRKLNEVLETHAKVAHMIDKLNKGWDWGDAVASTKRHLFDYADLTPREKAIRRFAVPFFTWTRKAIPMITQSVIQKPGKLSRMALLEQAWQRGDDGFPMDTTVIPEWVQQQMFGQAETDEGNLEVRSGIGNPVEVLNLLDLGRGGQEFLNMLAPPIKAVLQGTFDQSIFTGGPLPERISNTAGAGLEYIEAMPGGDAFTEAIGFKKIMAPNGKLRGYRVDPYVINVLQGGPFSSAGGRTISTLDRGLFPDKKTSTREQSSFYNPLSFRKETLTPKQRQYWTLIEASRHLEDRFKEEVRKGTMRGTPGGRVDIRKDVFPRVSGAKLKRIKKLKALLNRVRGARGQLSRHLDNAIARDE